MFKTKSVQTVGNVRRTCSILWLLTAVLMASQPVAAESPEIKRPFRSSTDQVYCEVAGTKQGADVYLPDDQALHPGVLLIHGGAWSSGDKSHMRDHGRELAQAGYVAVVINYRLAPRFKYPAQLDDCRAALVWVKEHAAEYHIDLNRLAVYGYSAGGHLAAMLATDPVADLPPIRVAVLGGAPCDLTLLPEDSRVIAHVLGGTRSQRPLAYQNASPINYLSSDDCPMFFFHGGTDAIVPQQWSLAMYERAKTLGITTEYYVVEKQGHLITYVHPEARRAAIAFLNTHLQQAQ